MKPWTFATCASAGAQHVKPVSVALEGQRLQTVLKQKKLQIFNPFWKTVGWNRTFCIILLSCSSCPKHFPSCAVGVALPQGAFDSWQWLSSEARMGTLPKQQPESQIEIERSWSNWSNWPWVESGITRGFKGNALCFLIFLRWEKPQRSPKDREFLERSLRSLRSRLCRLRVRWLRRLRAVRVPPLGRAPGRGGPAGRSAASGLAPEVQTCQAEGRRERQRKSWVEKEISKKETNGGKTIEEWKVKERWRGKDMERQTKRKFWHKQTCHERLTGPMAAGEVEDRCESNVARSPPGESHVLLRRQAEQTKSWPECMDYMWMIWVSDKIIQNCCSTHLVLLRLGLAEGCAKLHNLPLFCTNRLKVCERRIFTTERGRP